MSHYNASMKQAPKVTTQEQATKPIKTDFTVPRDLFEIKGHNLATVELTGNQSDAVHTYMNMKARKVPVSMYSIVGKHKTLVHLSH